MLLTARRRATFRGSNPSLTHLSPCSLIVPGGSRAILDLRAPHAPTAAHDCLCQVPTAGAVWARMLSVAIQALIFVDVSGKVQHWSSGADQLFGYRAAEVLGELVDFMVPEAHRVAHWDEFRRAMANPEIKDMAADLPVLCRDGEVRHFAGRLLALSDGLGVSVGAVAIYTNAASTGLRPFG